MDRPRVIIHNLISLDGRLDGFPLMPGSATRWRPGCRIRQS